MSEREGVLDWVERGCKRLMAQGGGPLVKEQDWAACKRRAPTAPEDIARIVELANRGTMTAKQIADALGLTARQVQHITYYRDIRLPHDRPSKRSIEAA